MPNLEEMIQQVSTKTYEEIAQRAISKYMEENADLYDDLVEEIATRIKTDSESLNRIKEAVVSNIINSLEERQDTNISIGVLDSLAVDLNEVVVSRLRSAIQSI